MAGLHSEDVYHVQRRNFAAAFVHRLGLWWADSEGTGALHDERMWTQFAAMRAICEEAYGDSASQSATGENVENDAMRPADRPVLTVVVDETSRFFQQCDEKLNAQLLHRARDCALRAGVPTQFCLFQDVLREKTAPSAVYLFVNLFSIKKADREWLHDIFERQEAAVIWLYAPGFFDETSSAENISETTRIRVKAFEGPARAGSEYQLAGRWIGQGEAFGESEEWQPLFYIEETDTNTIANFRDSKRASAAMEFLEAGWSSVYIADPGISPGLLQEILHVLEQHLYLRKTLVRYYDTIHLGPNLLAIHARESGERIIDLGRTCAVQDLFDSELGWPKASTFSLPMKSGETRLFRLKPLDLEDLP
jgi:hypothetical protein